jgi:hypothetical protein
MHSANTSHYIVTRTDYKPGQLSRYSDWLRAGRPLGRNSIPGRVKNFVHDVKTGSEAHPASYPKGTGSKAAGV